MQVIQKMKKTLQNNQGQANLVFSLALMMFLVIVFSVCVMFTQALYIIQNVADSSQIALDTYTSQMSASISDSIKNGNDITDGVQTQKYAKLLEQQLILDDNLSCYYDDEKLKYQIQDIELSCQRSNQLETKAEITLNYPLYFMGAPVTSFNKTITVNSHYYLK